MAAKNAKEEIGLSPAKAPRREVTGLARHLGRMKKSKAKVVDSGEELLASFKSAAGVILAVTENRHWIEVFFDGVIMHTETVNLPVGKNFTIYVEEIGHKTTVYEHPRTMIYFDGPYDLRVIRDGERVIVSGTPNQRENLA